jgi:hypothetical protein
VPAWGDPYKPHALGRSRLPPEGGSTGVALSGKPPGADVEDVATREIIGRDVPKVDSPLAARARRLVTPDRGRDEPPGDGGAPRRPRLSPPLPSGSETDVSDLASLLAELQRLLRRDAGRFEAVAIRVAEALEAHEGRDDGASDSLLAQLAARFREAARTRSLHALEEPGNGQGESGHPHSHVQAYAERMSPAAADDGPEPWAYLTRLVREAAGDASR